MLFVGLTVARPIMGRLSSSATPFRTRPVGGYWRRACWDKHNRCPSILALDLHSEKVAGVSADGSNSGLRQKGCVGAGPAGAAGRWRPGCRPAERWGVSYSETGTRPGRQRREVDRPGGRGFGSVSPRWGRWTFNVFCSTIRPKAGNDTWPRQVKLTFQFPDKCRRRSAECIKRKGSFSRYSGVSLHLRLCSTPPPHRRCPPPADISSL